MKKTVIAALVAALVLVAVLLWAALRPARRSPGEARSSTQPPSPVVPEERSPEPSAREAPHPPGPTGAPAPAANPLGGEPHAGSAPPPTGAANPGVPMSFIRRDYESEPRDADAAATEVRIRELYAATPDAEGVLRDVRCTRSVCRLDARWSPQLNAGYNAALIQVIAELSKEVSFEPGGPPDGTLVPMALFVRRPSPARP